MTDKRNHFKQKKRRKSQLLGALSMLAIVATIGMGIFMHDGADASEEEITLLRESDRCTRYFSAIEAQYGLPENLLRAISTVESGRWNRVTLTPITWPWTLNVDGRGYHYESKKEAIVALRTFEHNGAKLIDVGCMQINLRFHPEAFHNNAKALEPRYNIEYAAKLLKRHYRLTKNWQRAVARYHSATPHRGSRYASKVMKTWKQINRELALTEDHAPIPTAKVSMRLRSTEIDG